MTRMAQKPLSNSPMLNGSGTAAKSLAARSAMSESPAVVGCRSSQNRYWLGFTLDKPWAGLVTFAKPYAEGFVTIPANKVPRSTPTTLIP